jgi:hypothetical protein
MTVCPVTRAASRSCPRSLRRLRRQRRFRQERRPRLRASRHQRQWHSVARCRHRRRSVPPARQRARGLAPFTNRSAPRHRRSRVCGRFVPLPRRARRGTPRMLYGPLVARRQRAHVELCPPGTPPHPTLRREGAPHRTRNLKRLHWPRLCPPRSRRRRACRLRPLRRAYPLRLSRRWHPRQRARRRNRDRSQHHSSPRSRTRSATTGKRSSMKRAVAAMSGVTAGVGSSDSLPTDVRASRSCERTRVRLMGAALRSRRNVAGEAGEIAPERLAASS